MKKISKILVPVDFSNCSENALTFAVQLAEKINANLLLLNIPSVDTSNMENPITASLEVEENIRQAKRKVLKTVQKVTENLGSSLKEVPSIQTKIELGNVAATICEEVVKEQIDCIVMGTQGADSTLDKYLGSVASNVIKKAPCPVIVIPEKTEFAKQITMGYATDFSDADPFEIWKAVKLFQDFEPTIKCVHFNDQQDYSIEKLKELELYFSETTPELNIAFYNLPTKDKVKGMNNFIEEHNINMMVMYKPKRTFIDSFFQKSLTKQMAMHTKTPLFVLKEI